MRFGIGQPVRRKEDVRFLTGRGTYTDDINVMNQTHACFVYSPHAHADIVKIDTSAAEKAPGVVAVLTGADYAADKMGAIPPAFMPEDMGGPKGFRTARIPLAKDRVRHVGERVAMVIAETEAEARDAADLVSVEYKELPAVTNAKEATKDGAPLLYPGEELPKNNISVTLRFGDAAKTEEAFKAAAHISKVEIYNNRISAHSMEPRNCLADYNRADDMLTVYTSTQNPHGYRTELAHLIMHIPENNIRVVARDVGGGFGMKGGFYPEDACVAWAARKLQRPVKWNPTRSESFLGDDNGRDHTVEAELALDKDGKILALRWNAYHNMGAYIVGAAIVSFAMALRLAPNVYDIPVVDVLNRAVLTNTIPTSPYRGAGRPEGVYTIERLLDVAAREMGIDPLEIRRRNFIPPEKMPYHTHGHFVYDSGDYAAVLDDCRDKADWKGFDARRAVSEKAGKLRGRGVAYYTDDNGIFNERMELRFDPSGSLTVVAGTFSHGQGHETTYAQMLTDWLGVPYESIRFQQGDTAANPLGRGTYGSRSMTIGGAALHNASEDLIKNGKRFAAHYLEASADDIEFADGTFRVAGTDKAMPITALAQASFAPVGLPVEVGIGLTGTGYNDGANSSYPNGCHICEVEIDPDTGTIAIDRYAAVDDIGTVINPLLAEGQIIGGIVQGLGQALLEDMSFDPESGQLLTGSFMDYAMPRADDVPNFELGWHPVPCKTNPLGVKGAGEGGTVCATPTLVNAICDALESKGVKNMQMPMTPERVWRALNG